MGGSTADDLQRLRRRLNVIVLAVPQQFITLTAIYWLRFVPPLRPFAFTVPAPSPGFLLLCAATLVLPAVLPSAYFRTRSWERGRFYPALGLRWFRWLAPDGDWVAARLRRVDPSYRLIRTRQDRDAHIVESRRNEAWHLSWGLLGAVTTWHAWATGQSGWAMLIAGFNLVFNVYPVCHQRYKRARLRDNAGRQAHA
ncbi:MAG: hypothetical protein AMXMBFR57_31990 [Acidimicrobiia bacterium]